MRVRFRGRWWRVEFRPKSRMESDGFACAPHLPERKRVLAVRSDLSGQRLLETLIHEADHCCYWDLAEEVIEQGARDKARFLWRLGWRPPAK